MFADACQKAMGYTRPVAVSTRTLDGTLRTDIASFIVVNKDGWAITAGHVFDSFAKFQSDSKKMEEIDAINSGRSQGAGKPSSEIKKDKSFLTNHSFWWGWDGVMLSTVTINRQADIALVKLENFDPKNVPEYPVFADSSHMRIGTNVCRGGYPFIEITPKFLEDRKAFSIPSIPHDKFFYPIDGIFTHYEDKGKSKDGSLDLKYIETSSIGLRGQSGGPIFDAQGRIYGMQILTEHRVTGFHPTAEVDNQKYIETQFMNVGIGLHVDTILQLMDMRNVRYQKEGDESGFRIVD